MGAYWCILVHTGAYCAFKKYHSQSLTTGTQTIPIAKSPGHMASREARRESNTAPPAAAVVGRSGGGDRAREIGLGRSDEGDEGRSS